MAIEDTFRAAFEGIEGTYYTGTEAMVAKKLTDTMLVDRYPLIAVVLPVFERTNADGYVTITIPRIVFGMVTQSTDTPAIRLEKIFKLILTPVYEAYLKSLCKQAGVIDRDWRLVQKEKHNSYGEIQATDKIKDVLDSIEVKNLIIRVQPQIC